MQSSNLTLIVMFSAMGLMIVALDGCVSVQIPSAAGPPRVVGVGRATRVAAARGQIYRLTSPGLSLRFQQYSPGFSVGWQRTELFFPSTPKGTVALNHPVAVQSRCWGLDISPGQFALGYHRAFAVPQPQTDKNVTQIILYSAVSPSNTLIEQREEP